MRFLYFIVLVAFIGFGSWWLFNNNTAVKQFVGEIGNDDQFLALEVRYSPDQIMEQNQEELLQTRHDEYGHPALTFHPYLLMEVKLNSPQRKQREGIMLWNLTNGELILDTNTWEATKGFSNVLSAGGEGHDVKVVKTLSERSNGMTREELMKALRIDADTFDDWIESAREKKLVIQRGNTFRLFNPQLHLQVTPQTRIHQWLVTKPYGHAKRAAKRYDEEQVQEMALAAFGPELKIRETKQVYLPVYSIPVKGRRGSVSTSQWNALNGQRMSPTAVGQ